MAEQPNADSVREAAAAAVADHKITLDEKPGPRWGFTCSCGEARYGPYPHKVNGWVREHLHAVIEAAQIDGSGS
jgi:hypothetical protein